MHALPAPDFLELTFPPDHCCLISGTEPLSQALAEALTAHGWNVALWQPTSNEAEIQQQLATLTAAHGPVAAFIHLHPPSPGTYFSAADETSLKQSFLLAKHLQAALTAAARQGYAAFVTVTRLDGALGLTGHGSPVAGGLFGLTKTLALEWRTAGPHGVFCRAVDIAPAFNPQLTIQTIIAELHDPHRRLVEVGWSNRGRVTLVGGRSPTPSVSNPAGLRPHKRPVVPEGGRPAPRPPRRILIRAKQL